MSSLETVLKKHKKRLKAGPLWKGPEEEGISQSLIGNYLVCGERFRIASVLGLGVDFGFSHRMEYGNMFHLCIENQADDWESVLRNYCKRLCMNFPTDQAEINKWYKICKMHFPIYLEYYKRQDKSKKWVEHEKQFKVHYELPSGRVVILRGKIDGVFKKGKQQFNAERKIRGEIDEVKTTNQMRMDMQSMTYGVCMDEMGLPVKGVLYDVVKRPLSSGKGCIKQHKERRNKAGEITKPAETMSEYLSRLEVIIKENQHEFFQRWDVTFKKDALEEYKRQFLNPVLENICDDYEWWKDCHELKEDVFDYDLRSKVYPHHQKRHYVFPYGVYHGLAQGRPTEYDEYLKSGSTVGLKRKDTMFPELEEEE